MLPSPQRLGALAFLLVLSSWSALRAEAISCRTRVENFPIVGDLVIECTGGTPTPGGQALPSVDFEVELNTNISSRLLEGDALEALMLIDDPAPANQIPGKTLFQARSIEGNRLRIPGVLFDPPGAGRTRILRLRNLRVDASEFDVDDSGAGDIILSLRATGILEAPLGAVSEKVAVTQRSFNFSIGDAAGVETNVAARLLRSHDNNGDLFADPTADFSSPGGRSFTLRFQERLETAFRRRVFTDLLGRIQNQSDPAERPLTESGFFNSSLPSAGGLDRAGLADSGTRLMAVFGNVPDGVAIFVTIGLVGSNRFVDAELISTDPDGSNLEKKKVLVVPTSLADRGLAPVAIQNGRGQAVWEITASSVDAIDTVTVGVTVAYLRDVPALGAASVSGTFAPFSDSHGSSLKAPLPRFSQSGTTRGAFEITLGDACGVAIQDVVLGGLRDPLKDDVFAFDALTGTLLDLQVTTKGKTGPVEMRLFDPSLAQIDIASFVKSRGSSAKLKGFPLFDTGEYQVVLRGPGSASLDYRLNVRGKLPKSQLKIKAVRNVSAAGERLFQEVEAVKGSSLDVILKGKGIDPEILEVVEPSQGAALSIDAFLKPGAKTEKLTGLLLPVTGKYQIAFTGLGGAGSLSLSARVKGPGRRVLEECAE
jgi:hypothetical protein